MIEIYTHVLLLYGVSLHFLPLEWAIATATPPKSTNSRAQLRSSGLLSGFVYLTKVDQGLAWMSTENMVLKWGYNKGDMHM